MVNSELGRIFLLTIHYSPFTIDYYYKKPV